MMKGNRRLFVLLLGLTLLLSACAAPAQDAPAPSPSPTLPPLEAPVIEGKGAMAEAARALLSVYEEELNRVSLRARGNLTYTIPGDVINKMVQDAAQLGVRAREGRYQFIWRQTGEHTYLATGLEVEEEMEAENAFPAQDTPMGTEQMGDYVAEGGGMFDRTCVYDAAEDLSQGTADITDILNSELTGHEVFSFAVRSGALYFVDAALDMTPGLDGLENQGRYLVAAGVLSRDGLEIIEYYIPDQSQAPDAASLDWEQLLAAVTPVSRLSAQGEQVSVWP